MKKTLRALGWMVLCAGLLSLVIVAEESLRAAATEKIPVQGLPLPRTQVEGYVKPDWLWSGKAWWIDIHSEHTLDLQLDDKIYRIPPGHHQLYSNHDATNTADFGDGPHWGFPAKVAVRISK